MPATGIECGETVSSIRESFLTLFAPMVDRTGLFTCTLSTVGNRPICKG